jgi:hypothetical protein
MERLDNSTDFRLSLRRRAVMKRKRPAFIFQDQAGSIRRERRKLWPQAIECCRAGAVDNAIESSFGAPSFEPVQTRCGTLPRLEQPVELSQRAATDQRERSLALRRKPDHQRWQAVWYSHKFRTGSDLEQRPVDIEEQRRSGIQRRRPRFGERQQGVFVRCTFLRRGMCAKCLICPRFLNHAKAFPKRGLTLRSDALNCAVR